MVKLDDCVYRSATGAHGRGGEALYTIANSHVDELSCASVRAQAVNIRST